MDLIAKNLVFAYDKNPVLKIALLEIKAHSKVFVYGPSGCGKSTLLNLCAGVLAINSGELKLLNTEMSLLSSTSRDRFRAQNLGLIFQQFNLLPYLSVMENIMLPSILKKLDGTEKNRLEHRAHDLIKRLGLETFLKRSVMDLSLGQQQRVAQARALLMSPKMIIADEPTSSLDEKNTSEFMNLLLEEWQVSPFTLLFVSHDQRLKKYFDVHLNLEELNEAKV